MSEIIGVGSFTITDLNDAIISSTEPERPTEGLLWIDDSAGKGILKVYNNGNWVIRELDVNQLDPDLAETVQNIIDTLGTIANDGELDLSERTPVVRELSEIIGEIPSKAIGNVYPVSLPSYENLDSNGVGTFASVRSTARDVGMSDSDSVYLELRQAYTNLNSFLSQFAVKPWDVTTTNKDQVTIIPDPDAFRQSFLDYYMAELRLSAESETRAKKQTNRELADKATKGELEQTVTTFDAKIENTGDQILATVSELNETQDGELKKYTDSKVLQTADEFSVEISKITPSEVNLLKDSKPNITSTVYLIASFDLINPPAEGEEVTVVIKGELNRDHWGLYNSGGSVSIERVDKTSDMVSSGIWKKTFPWVVGASNNTSLRVYPFPNDSQENTLEWIKLVRGNKTSNDWTPAPKDVSDSVEALRSETSSKFTQTIEDFEFSFTGLQEGLDNVNGAINNAKTTIDSSGITVKDGSFYLQDVVASTKYSIIDRGNYIHDPSFENVVKNFTEYTYVGEDQLIEPRFEGAHKYKPALKEMTGTDWYATGIPYLTNQFYTESGVKVGIHGRTSFRINSVNTISSFYYNFSKNQTLTLSAFSKKVGTSIAGALKLSVYMTNLSGSGADVLVKTQTFATVKADGSIQRDSMMFTLPPTYDANEVALWVQVEGANANYIYVDGIQLVDGNLPTIFSVEQGLVNFMAGNSTAQQLLVNTIDIRSDNWNTAEGIGGGINMGNSDITQANSIWFNDIAQTNNAEGLLFLKSGQLTGVQGNNNKESYDNLLARDGELKFNARTVIGDDTGWVNISLKNGAQEYSSGNTPQCRKIRLADTDLLLMRGAFRNITSNDTVVGTMPFTIANSFAFIQLSSASGSGNTFVRWGVRSNGNIEYERKSNGDNNAGHWCPIDCTMMV